MRNNRQSEETAIHVTLGNNLLTFFVEILCSIHANTSFFVEPLRASFRSIPFESGSDDATHDLILRK